MNVKACCVYMQWLILDWSAVDTRTQYFSKVAGAHVRLGGANLCIDKLTPGISHSFFLSLEVEPGHYVVGIMPRGSPVHLPPRGVTWDRSFKQRIVRFLSSHSIIINPNV